MKFPDRHIVASLTRVTAISHQLSQLAALLADVVETGLGTPSTEGALVFIIHTNGSNCREARISGQVHLKQHLGT